MHRLIITCVMAISAASTPVPSNIEEPEMRTKFYDLHQSIESSQNRMQEVLVKTMNECCNEAKLWDDRATTELMSLLSYFKCLKEFIDLYTSELFVIQCHGQIAINMQVFMGTNSNDSSEPSSSNAPTATFNNAPQIDHSLNTQDYISSVKQLADLKAETIRKYHGVLGEMINMLQHSDAIVRSDVTVNQHQILEANFQTAKLDLETKLKQYTDMIKFFRQNLEYSSNAFLKTYVDTGERLLKDVEPLLRKVRVFEEQKASRLRLYDIHMKRVHDYTKYSKNALIEISTICMKIYHNLTRCKEVPDNEIWPLLFDVNDVANINRLTSMADQALNAYKIEFHVSNLLEPAYVTILAANAQNYLNQGIF